MAENLLPRGREAHRAADPLKLIRIYGNAEIRKQNQQIACTMIRVDVQVFSFLLTFDQSMATSNSTNDYLLALHRHRNAKLLPVPNGEEIAWFQGWYKQQKGIDLPYEVARPMLTHLVQFYFLTRGHELYDRNQAILRSQGISHNNHRHNSKSSTGK